jgi:putative peptidoglycan lipid II flippase
MVTTIYFHGDFTANGVRMTALSLVAFSLGMVAIVMVKVLAPGFYARQNTRTPVRVAMVSMGLNIVFCLILVSPMKHVGLALATSLSSLFNAAMLFVLLRREGVLRIESGWLVFLGRTLVATLLMGVLLWVFRGEGAGWLEYSIWERVTRLFLLIGFGGMLYIVALLVMGLRPRALFLRRES